MLLFNGASFTYTIPSRPTDRQFALGCNWFNFPSRSISADEASVELNPPYSETDGALDDPARAYATAPVSDYYGSDTLADALAVVNQSDGDQDGDELPDSVEAQFGTDPANVDTDGDGRSDWEEIQVYGTDPLNINDPGLVAFDQDVAYANIPDRGATTDGAGAYGADTVYYPNDATAVFGAALDDQETEIWLDPAYALPDDASAAQENPAASVSIRVHSCPDDLDASGFYQYSLQCTSERGLYGVPLGLETSRSPVSFLYSQPDGTGQAAPMVWNGVSGRSFTVREVVTDRPRESVVFCSDRQAGNNPGTLDGTEIPLVDGKMTLPISAGVQFICEWYRFPGGISAEPDEAEAGAGAQPATDGATIAIQTWICPTESNDDPDQADDQPSTPGNANPERDLASLQDTCSQSRTSTSFRLAGDDQEHPERQIGGQEANHLGWTGLDAGTYSIESDLVTGGAEPTVFCEGSVPGRRTVRRNLNQLPVSGGTVSYTLAENETLTCEWFNIGEEETGGTGGDGAMNSSITVYVWNCPAGSDVLIAAGGGECTEPLDGLTFTATGPDGYQSQSDTGDSIPGTVFFGGIAPGAYTLTAANGYLGDPAVVCDDQVVFAPDGILIYDLTAGETLACDWFTTSDDSIDSNTGEGEVVDVGTNDQDDDGLVDTDETDLYGTDPLNPDSDNDAVGDGDEVTYFLDPLNPDTDADGLLDGDEIYSAGTDPLNADTDGDGAIDGIEIDAGTDPLNYDDYPDA